MQAVWDRTGQGVLEGDVIVAFASRATIRVTDEDGSPSYYLGIASSKRS